MSKTEFELFERDQPGGMKLRLIDWVEGVEFAVAIRHVTQCPNHLEVRKIKYGKRDFGIFNCGSAGGVPRFRRRKWQSCVSC